MESKIKSIGCEKLQTALRAASLLVNLQITTKCMKLINLPICWNLEASY